MRRLQLVAAVASSVGLLLSAPPARAHFALLAPDCWSEQDAFGLPEKSPPCGQADPGTPLKATGLVTSVQEGSMVTITIDEKIFHPGHYRVSLGLDQNSLPADPPVTPGATQCGSTVISNSPTLPLLADGLLVHDMAFTTTKTIQVQLPPNITCPSCVLQVTEFMSDHPLNNPGGCFYHHCATLSITALPDSGLLETGGEDAGSDAGMLFEGDAGEAANAALASCGCSAQQGSVPFALGTVLAIVAFGLRRRRHG